MSPLFGNLEGFMIADLVSLGFVTTKPVLEVTEAGKAWLVSRGDLDPK